MLKNNWFHAIGKKLFIISHHGLSKNPMGYIFAFILGMCLSIFLYWDHISGCAGVVSSFPSFSNKVGEREKDDPLNEMSFATLMSESNNFDKIQIGREYQVNNGTTKTYQDIWGDSNHGLQSTKFLSYVCYNLARSKYLQEDMYYIIIEIGTFRGFNTYNLAVNCPTNSRIITLDQNFSMFDPNVADKKYPKYIMGEAFINAPANIKNKISQWIGDTKEFDDLKYENKVALIWVDAGHSFEMCTNDWLKALQMIKIGGHIFCDDVGSYWPGVVQCVNFIQSYLKWNSTKQWITGNFRVGGAYAWFTRLT